MGTIFKILRDLLSQRILMLDGPKGTLIQGYKLSDADFRGERFKDHPVELKGNNDILVLTQPELIKNIHRAHADAGSDFIGTNTFNGNAISQADYKTEKFAYEINFEAAKIAKEVAEEYTKKDPTKPRFVTGTIGPTNKTLSMSPDVNDPGYRAVSFDYVKDIYMEQARGLIDGGADVLLIETIFDTLNAKAAIYAILDLCEQKGIQVPIMISGTVIDQSGRTRRTKHRSILDFHCQYKKFIKRWAQLFAGSFANETFYCRAISNSKCSDKYLSQRRLAE